MVRSCCFPGCSNREGCPVSFYSFPLDEDQRNNWIGICNLSVYRKSCKVCSEHFLPNDFRDVSDTSKGLLHNAVPVFQEETPGEIEYLDECESEVQLFLQSSATTNQQSTEPELDYKTLYLQEKAKNSQFEDTKKEVTRLKKQNRRQKKLLEVRREKIVQLKKLTIQKSKITQKDRKLVQALRNNPFLYECVENALRHKNGRRYKVARFVTSKIKLASTSGYKTLRDAGVLTIPHPRTISMWHKDMSIKPGFNSGLLRRMKKAARKMTAREKVVAVLVDGIAIRPDVTFHSKTDTFAGFPDDGSNPDFEDNDPDKLATEAITIMARSIYSSYKQILGHFLADSVIESSRQGEIIKEAIRLLRQCGFTPVVVIMDQHPTNCKMIRLLGATVEEPVFEVDGQKVVVMYDTPHLLKSVRNNLLTKDFNYNNTIVSFDHLLKFYELDSQRNPRLAPKFDRKCLIEGTFDKMNVSYVAHVFSDTVASAMETLIELGDLPETMKDTPLCLRDMDTFFDTFNSKSPVDESKPFRVAISDNSIHWEFLERFKESIKNYFFVPKPSKITTESPKKPAKLTSSQRKPPCLTGIVHNINALPILWSIVKEHNFEHLCMSKVTQDALENSFAAARRSCGSNDSPNANEFGIAVRHYCCRKTLDDFYGANCQADDTCTNHEENEDLDSEDSDGFSTNDPTEDPLDVYPIEPLDEDAEIPSLPVLNSLIFTIGYAVSKMKHDECQRKLSVKTNYSSEKYLFMRMKTASNNGKLTIPNECAFEIGSTLLFAMEQKFLAFLRESKTGVRHRLQNYVSYDDYREVLCNACFDSLVVRILNTLLGGQTRKIKNNYNRRNAAAARGKFRKGKRKGIIKETTIPRKICKKDKPRSLQQESDDVSVSCVICNDNPKKTSYCELYPFSDKNQPVHIRRYLAICNLSSSSGFSNSMVICSTHFTPDCFDESSGQRILRDGAIPTLNLEIQEYDDEDAQALDEYMRLTEVEQQQMASGMVLSDLADLNMIDLPQNAPLSPEQEHQQERIIRKLHHLTLEEITATYQEHRNELLYIFEKYKNETERSLMKNEALLNWLVATNILTDDQAYYMSVYLSKNLVPKVEEGMYTEFIDIILVWEWAVRILMNVYNYNRNEAIQQIINQDMEAIINDEVPVPD